jgi:hypothetical protein
MCKRTELLYILINIKHFASGYKARGCQIDQQMSQGDIFAAQWRQLQIPAGKNSGCYLLTLEHTAFYSAFTLKEV